MTLPKAIEDLIEEHLAKMSREDRLKYLKMLKQEQKRRKSKSKNK